MKYLLVFLLIGGMTGDRPNVTRNQTYPDATYSGPAKKKATFDCTKPLKRMRVLKCNGNSVFEVATKLIYEGYCDPYSGEDCGVGITGRQDVTIPAIVKKTRGGRSVVGQLEGGGKGRYRRSGQTIYDTVRPQVTEYAADTSVVDVLFESCWRNFLRYMGVANWRDIPINGPYPPTAQPGILRPISNLRFVPNARWENFECRPSIYGERAPKIADYSKRKRRYIGSGGFILEKDKKSSDAIEYQDIIDYIDSKLAELGYGTEDRDIQSQIRTSYQTRTGRVDNQGIYRQGKHSSNDTITLVSGEALIDINTKVSPGRVDGSFLNAQSYGGYAYTLDTTNTATYQLVPISGKRFKIISSDSTDTATVHFRVEGD